MDFLIFIAAIILYMAIGSFIAGLIDDTGETIAIYVFFWPLMLVTMFVFSVLTWIAVALRRIFKK